MSVFCSSSATSRTIVSKLAQQQVLLFLYPIDIGQNTSSAFQRHICQKSLLQKVANPITLEKWFYNSLASAGNCRNHQPKEQRPGTLFTSQRQTAAANTRQMNRLSFQRYQHTKAFSALREGAGEIAAAEPNRTKEELMALVDQYSGESYTDQLPLLELPNLHQPSDGPHLTVSDQIEDEWPPPHDAWPADPETETKLQLLDDALKNWSKDPDEIYQLYRALPDPRAPYLESKTRHKLLRQLAVVERKDEESMLRYLSVVDDMKGTAIPLNSAEWTSAISFAARYVARSTEVEVESALHMWREMEHIAGVKGSDATFNVLFDVACKAGKFTLAEKIYEEMVSRGFEYNRFHHVSQIHYYGLKGDGDGARRAYKELVEAGEIVDTVVLNCMISSLVRAHEANAAEAIYERMKKIHIETSGSPLPPRDYKAQREITLVLMKMAKIAKVDPSRREEFQQKSIVAPNLQTYRILVNYFAVQAGELDKAAKFLDEMKWFNLPLHGALFLALLKGFYLHGGIRYTQWTEDRLESVWNAFMQAIENEYVDLYISKWIVVWALRAFWKCSGKPRMVDVWEEIKQKWHPEEGDMDFVMKTLQPLLDSEDMAEKKNWILGPLK